MSESSDNSDLTLFETAVALEIMRFQRDSLQAQIDLLTKQLQSATKRAERAEERLHETTIMLSNLGMQTASVATRSSLTEVIIEGRSALRLDNPVVVPNQTVSARSQ